MQNLPPSPVMHPRGTLVTMVNIIIDQDPQNDYHHLHHVIIITITDISGYYREAPVVVLRGPHQPHQQQAHQHQAQHPQQVCL